MLQGSNCDSRESGRLAQRIATGSRRLVRLFHRQWMVFRPLNLSPYQLTCMFALGTFVQHYYIKHWEERQRPRQESNLVFDLRRVACKIPPHPEDVR